MGFFLLTMFLIWNALLLASNSITLLKGRSDLDSKSLSFAPGLSFPYSKHLARRIKLRPQKLLLLLVFYVLCLFVLLIFTLFKKDLVADTTSFFTIPFLLMTIYSFITLPAILVITIGDPKHLKCYKLYVDEEGYITYFYIGERYKKSTNPVYIFYLDRITRISHIEAYAYYTKLICDVERTLFRHQDTHLSEEGIRSTGETSLAADQTLWIPHVFEGFH